MDIEGLNVKVTLNQFKAEQDVNKKLDMLFVNQIAHQGDCNRIVNKFNDRLDGCSEEYKKIESKVVLPRRNRKIDFGVGAGGGTLGYVVIDKIYSALKSYLAGG